MSQPFHDHFSGVADRYANFRPEYPAKLFEYLASLVPRDVTVWDCACGNGQATRDFASRFQTVIGTDASPEQIASAPPHPRIEYRVASAEESGLPDKSVGLVAVAQALHWFNHDRFYAEVNRVLTSDGLIAVWAYGINTVEGETANELIQDFYHDIVGPFWPPERKLVEEGYRTIPFPFREIPAPTFQMEARWTLEQVLGYLSTWSAASRYAKENGKNPLEPLREALKQVWENEDDSRKIIWPLSLRVGKPGSR